VFPDVQNGDHIARLRGLQGIPHQKLAFSAGLLCNKLRDSCVAVVILHVKDLTEPALTIR
jgi:hypothetical protein